MPHNKCSIITEKPGQLLLLVKELNISQRWHDYGAVGRLNDNFYYKFTAKSDSESILKFNQQDDVTVMFLSHSGWWSSILYYLVQYNTIILIYYCIVLYEQCTLHSAMKHEYSTETSDGSNITNTPR